MSENILKKFKLITAFAFDMDGVLTNGKLICDTNGEQLRIMNIKDGYAMNEAIKKNYQMIIISGSESIGARIRLEKLGLTNIFMNVDNKKKVLDKWMTENEIKPENLLYMGDDIPDMEVIKFASIGACPKDATQDILEISDYISPYNGGDGCVRDVIEKVMKLQGKW